MGVIVFKRKEPVYCFSKHFLEWGKKVYRLFKHIYVFSLCYEWFLKKEINFISFCKNLVGSILYSSVKGLIFSL